MFGKKKMELEKISSEEMEAFLSRGIKRIIIINAFWILFVIVMLFWKPVVGAVLLIITAIKYLYDYYDVDSRSHFFSFLEMMRKKRDTENTK
jgi:sterol desaturase/sphingolipid hydroxylase (fatty acid hydroxylase superfamily)